MPEENITNKVLETKIDGLSKLTDERFSNIKESLIRIESNNLGFATKIDLEETKKDFNHHIEEIKKGFIQHNLEDRDSFGGLDKGQRELRDTIKMWGGVVAVVSILFPIIIPIVLSKVFGI